MVCPPTVQPPTPTWTMTDAAQEPPICTCTVKRADEPGRFITLAFTVVGPSGGPGSHTVVKCGASVYSQDFKDDLRFQDAGVKERLATTARGRLAKCPFYITLHPDVDPTNVFEMKAAIYKFYSSGKKGVGRWIVRGPRLPRPPRPATASVGGQSDDEDGAPRPPTPPPSKRKLSHAAQHKIELLGRAAVGIWRVDDTSSGFSSE